MRAGGYILLLLPFSATRSNWNSTFINFAYAHSYVARREICVVRFLDEWESRPYYPSRFLKGLSTKKAMVYSIIRGVSNPQLIKCEEITAFDSSKGASST